MSTRGFTLPSVVPGDFQEIDERLLQVTPVLGLFQALLESLEWPLIPRTPLSLKTVPSIERHKATAGSILREDTEHMGEDCLDH
jgi:hypothetical protein